MTDSASPRFSISFLSSWTSSSREEQEDTTTHKSAPDKLAVTDRTSNDNAGSKPIATPLNENDSIKNDANEGGPSDEPAAQEDWYGPESYDDGVSVISDRTRTNSVKRERRPSLLNLLRKKKSEPQVDISKRPHYGYEIY